MNDMSKYKLHLRCPSHTRVEDTAMHSARLALLVYFAYYMIQQLNALVQDPTAPAKHGFAIVQVTLVVACAYVAMGTFRQAKALNDTLQTAVQ